MTTQQQAWLGKLKDKMNLSDAEHECKSFLDFKNDTVSVCSGRAGISNREEATSGFSWELKTERDFETILSSI